MNEMNEQTTEERQGLNELVANIPEEFPVNGKIVRIHSKTMRELVEVDRARSKLKQHLQARDALNLKLQTQRQQILSQISNSTDDNIDDLWDQLEVVNETLVSEELLEQQRELEVNCYDALIDVLFVALNKDVQRPEYDKTWLGDNISVDLGNQIVDAYRAKNDTNNFFYKVQTEMGMF